MKLFRLTNKNGATVELSSLGAAITSLIVPDRDGRLEDVVLGYADPADWLDDGPCAGKTPGRFANRIAQGRFSIDGKEYQLTCNNGPNALHGGPTGFYNRDWDAEEIPGGVRFSRLSPDGEEGYPGNLNVTVTYLWDDDNRLTIDFSATTDSPTIVNLTNHAYFNLAGHNAGSAMDHMLQLPCSRYLRTDSTDIPSGDIPPVNGTPMDFTTPRQVGARLLDNFENLASGKGYNHFFLIDGWKPDGNLRVAARLNHPASGRSLTVLTTAPGLMLYTGNWLDGSPINKCGRRYNDYDGIALECQLPPDAPNHPHFHTALLRPGDIYRQRIVYDFNS